ncbi:site-specific integrase [Paenibacillus amylolyticus]|uniref:Tyrosine recombinase, XerC n=1 Tax=Paenibacillus amylolyticus TaxID=1451 RepID=A0A124DXT2_PAEAM|nr:tyrosine recombinase, XerC [Paenibacillus amylolyticus]
MNYVEAFLLYLQTDKDLSGLTIENYARDIKGFLSFERTPPEVTAIEPSQIRKYITHFDCLGRARSTINPMLCALKIFF